MGEDSGKTIKIKIPKLDIWRILTIVFAVIILAQLFGFFNLTGLLSLPASTLSSQKIGENVVNYINQNLVQPGTKVSLISVEDVGGVYKIMTSYQGQQIPVYASKDGRFLFLPQGTIDMTETRPTQQTQEQPQQEVPKTDRPVAELYIFSYCPYGVNALDAFVEPSILLKEYADFKVKFFSHMHGEHEKQQNMIQECIQIISPEKYWNYAKEFKEKVYQKCAVSRSLECDKNESIALMKSVGIDFEKVLECVKKNGEKYYQQDIEDANKLGLTGSPSFVVNGVVVRNVNRSPEGIKTLVCSAFNKPPEKCSQVLSASSGSPTGGC